MLATVVRTLPPTSARPGDKAVITADGRLRGWIGGSCSEPLVKREALRALEDGQARLVQIVGGAEQVEHSDQPGQLRVATTCPSGGSLDIFVEPRLPRPLLVVFGGGPAARTLVQMAALTGFRTCAVHPGAQRDDFPEADAVLTDLDLSGAAIGPDTTAIVATMGHYDEDALAAALAYPHLEVGLVASARRAGAVREVLAGRGFGQSELARVRTPAGRRGGTTPAEIALFALADLIAARNQRRAGATGAGLQAAFTPVAADAPRFATDPVCGMTVELPGRHRALHAGQPFYFCCAGCMQSFEADPGRYLQATAPGSPLT